MNTIFQMIDIGSKQVTHRVAIAYGEIVVGVTAYALIRDNTLPKGNVLALAEAAGIQGAKKTYELIPLCHSIGMDTIRIITELSPPNILIVYCIASAYAKTGVEMEALTGVNTALLTIWDLTKMVEPNLQIQNVRLLAKKGGKSGLWLNSCGVPDWIRALVSPQTLSSLTKYTVAVLTLSDRASRGEYEDISGTLLKAILETAGYNICDYRIISDDKNDIKKVVSEIVTIKKPHLLITTGGTGVSSRDHTPDVLVTMFDKTIPGIGELLRHDGAQYTSLSWSSRAIGGVMSKTLVITLPGNPKAVEEGLRVLLPYLIPHLLSIINKED